jgi:hypothetical protein
MKNHVKLILVGGLLAVLPGLVSAQPSAHYVPGVEGIKGSSLPPPGVYLRDYNVFYFADRVNDANGDEISAADPKAFIYANVPRLLWITDVKVLGGFLGVDALLPFQYTELEVNTPGGPFKDNTFGIGDLFAEATLSWHVDQADFALAYGAWAPTGESSTSNPTEPGAGFWTHMFTAGMTWYMDPEKKWALSALNRYEINHEKKDTDWTPGQAYTLELGLSYAVSKTVDVGVAGYYQQQVTDDSPAGDSTRDKVLAVGPEIVMLCPKLGLFTSIRYNYEVLAEDRLQGHTVAVTFTKRF